jgi:REP element-mobilizing transposase RayT
LDEWIIMPNHLHGLLILSELCDVGAGHARPLQTIVGSFKSAAAKRINEIRGTPGTAVWQRNYYEHVVRDESALNRIREYIMANPARWADDPENLLMPQRM